MNPAGESFQCEHTDPIGSNKWTQLLRTKGLALSMYLRLGSNSRNNRLGLDHSRSLHAIVTGNRASDFLRNIYRHRLLHSEHVVAARQWMDVHRRHRRLRVVLLDRRRLGHRRRVSLVLRVHLVRRHRRVVHLHVRRRRRQRHAVRRHLSAERRDRVVRMHEAVGSNGVGQPDTRHQSRHRRVRWIRLRWRLSTRHHHRLRWSWHHLSDIQIQLTLSWFYYQSAVRVQLEMIVWNIILLLTTGCVT